jgi:prolyl-tRNA editing enzyme YbaK/EbsC (Cys-tRNA(Pro) deacylase)
MPSLQPSAQKVQDALRQLGGSHQVVEMAETTRTSKEAALAVGCTVEQIAKSIVFRARESGTAVLVIASGPNRVNESLIAAEIGEPVEKPDADFVLQQTGFVIGGVPPIAHAHPIRTFIDQDLLGYSEIWAAAGTPHAVFHLTPADLVRLTGGQVISVK